MMANNWQTVRLGEVLTVRQEKPSPDDLDSGAIRIVSKIGFNDGKIQLRNGGDTKTGMILVRPGDLIVSGINAVKGAIAIYDEKAIVPIAATIHYGSYIPNRERVDIHFLWWLLRSEVFREILLQNLPGGTKSELKPQRFLSVPVPLPSLSEQQRIVARVDALARHVEEARGLRRAAVVEVEALTYSALGQIFSDEATRGWERKKVEEICYSPQYGYTESAQIEKVGPKFLRITDIQDGRVNWDAVPYCVCKQGDLENYRLKAGDIVFARTGATTGKSFLIKDCPEAVFASYLIRLRVKGNVLPEFLLWYFQSPRYWDQVKAETKGSAQGNMNGKKLSAVDVRFPNSEGEQQRIVAYLDGLQTKVDELRRLQAATQKELDALMPSILAKAFAGEL